MRQRLDYSCGSAALATIVKFGFGEPVTEQQILDRLFANLTKSEKGDRQKAGFSLFDLQRVAQGLGFAAEGYQIDPHPF